MLRFVLRRFALLLLTLLVSSFIIFSALFIAPGDPLASLSGGKRLPPAVVESLTDRYNLEDPFVERYVGWLSSAVTGDLGESISLQDDVDVIIRERAPVTFQLVLLAGVVILVFGVGSGLLAALKPGPIDSAVVGTSAALIAVPSFIAAIFLVSLLSVQLGWFPALGAGEGFLDRLWHLTLPSIALAISAGAIVARVTRVSVRSELGREHVQTAIGRGLPFRTVVRRHVLRNAAGPIMTVTGVTIASLIALSAVVERAFALDGLGETLIDAASAGDFALVQGIALILVAAFVVLNALIDVLHAALDPRVTLGESAV